MLPSFLIVAVALLPGVQGRPYSEERQLLDRHLAQLSRALPDKAAPGDDEVLLTQLANDNGLRNIEIGAPTITETGSLGQSRRSLSATSTFLDADRFFRAVQSSPRLIDVESLVLRPADFGVRIETRLRLYHRAARAVPTANLDPGRMRDRLRGAAKEEAARFARDEQLALEKTIALDDLRRRQISPRMFLAETGASFRDAAAALTFGSLDGDTGRFTLRGVAAGMGAADSLERRLGGGFFRVREFSQARGDGCFQFEVVGESSRAGPLAALPLPIDEPFRPTEPLCHQDRDPGSAGTTLRVSGARPGGISLRAVDLDLADVAAIIETLTSDSFVVAENVRGRVNVDFAGASLDDVLRALSVRSDPVGGVQLLRSSASPPFPIPEADEGAEARFSMRAKRARGEDVLSAIAETDSSYAALGPATLPRVSVFAREAAVNDVRRAILAALQLEETREEGFRVLKFQEAGGEAGPITAALSPRVVFRARDLTIEELLLAGIGQSGSDLVAFVYSPLGEIVPLRLGDTLADGIVAGLDSNGLLVDTSEGPVRISLAQPGPR